MRILFNLQPESLKCDICKWGEFSLSADAMPMFFNAVSLTNL